MQKKKEEKACLLTRNIEEVCGKKVRRMGQQAEEKKKGGKTERVTGLGRRRREETAKWNQMTAFEIPDGRETSDIPGLTSEVVTESCNFSCKIF